MSMLARLFLIAIVAVVLGGFLYSSRWRTQEPVVSGTVEADEIRVGSRVGGRVAKVLVEEGQNVKLGETLVELEPFDLGEQRSQAEAEFQAARAQYAALAGGYRPEEIEQARAIRDQLAAKLSELENGPRPQEIAAAAARVELAQAEVHLADQNYRRVSRVVANRAGTQEELDQADEQLKSATSQLIVRQQELDLLREGTRPEVLLAAKAQLAEAEQGLKLREKGYREEDIQAAKARMEAARSALEILNRRLDELTIKAPVAGVIEALELQPGDLVAANAPVLSLLDMNHVWVRVYIPENYLEIQTGTKLHVLLDAYPHQTFEGLVTFVSREAEFTPRNVQTPEERSKLVFRAKVELPASQGRIRPGMGADVWLTPLD